MKTKLNQIVSILTNIEKKYGSMVDISSLSKAFHSRAKQVKNLKKHIVNRPLSNFHIKKFVSSLDNFIPSYRTSTFSYSGRRHLQLVSKKINTHTLEYQKAKSWKSFQSSSLSSRQKILNRGYYNNRLLNQLNERLKKDFNATVKMTDRTNQEFRFTAHFNPRDDSHYTDFINRAKIDKLTTDRWLLKQHLKTLSNPESSEIHAQQLLNSLYAHIEDSLKNLQNNETFDPDKQTNWASSFIKYRKEQSRMYGQASLNDTEKIARELSEIVMVP